MSPGSSTSALDAVIARASEYQLEALLAALFHHGFDWSSVRFEGVRELSPRPGALVRGARLEEAPARVCIIALDTGLLSTNSPLPEYFREFARRLPDPDSFISFVGFWDAALLHAAAYAAHPRLGVGQSRALSHAYRARLRLASPMALHWLFRSVFPELRVQVVGAVFRQAARSGRARVGSTLDGRLVIGADFTERQVGFRVALSVESAESEGVADWEREASARLARVEPWLTRMGKPLQVVLRFESYRHGHTLVAHDAERRQLGVRPWLRPRAGEALGPGEVVLRGASG